MSNDSKDGNYNDDNKSNEVCIQNANGSSKIHESHFSKFYCIDHATHGNLTMLFLDFSFIALLKTKIKSFHFSHCCKVITCYFCLGYKISVFTSF